MKSSKATGGQGKGTKVVTGSTSAHRTGQSTSKHAAGGKKKGYKK